MASFSNDQPQIGVPQYGDRPLDYAADKSRATLISGLTDAFKSIVTGADTLVRESIQTGAQKAVEGVDNAFGLPQAADTIANDTLPPEQQRQTPYTGPGQGEGPQVAAAYPVPPTGGTGGAGGQQSGGTATDDVVSTQQPMPSGLQSGLQKVNGIARAMSNASGGVPEAYYWMRMNQAMRDLRRQYPGYQDVVDSEFSKAMNYPTANRVREELFNKLGKESPDEKEYKQLLDWAIKQPEVGLPPGFFARQRNGNPMSLQELQSYISDKTNEIGTRKRREQDLVMDANQNKLDDDKVRRSYQTEVMGNVRTVINDSTNAVGKAWQELQTNLPAIIEHSKSGKGPNAQETAFLSARLATIEAGLGTRMAEVKNKIWNSSNDPQMSYGAQLKPEVMKAADEMAMSPVRVIKEALGDPTKLALLGSVKTWLDATVNDAHRKIMDQVPYMPGIEALTKAFGGAQAGEFMKMMPKTTQALENAMVSADVIKNFVPDYLMKPNQTPPPPGTPPAPGKQSFVIDDLKKWQANTDLTPSQKQNYMAGHLATLNNYAASIVNGGLPPETAKQYVQYMFGGRSAGLLGEFKPEDRARLYASMTSPQVTAAMQKVRDSGDIESWNTYRQWALNGFQAMARADLLAIKNFNEDQYPVKYQWNERTAQFTPQSNPDATKAGQYFGELPAQQSQDAIRRINSLVSQVAPIFKADQIDVGVQMKKLFEQLGLRTQIGPTSGSVANSLYNSLDQHTQLQSDKVKSQPFELGTSEPAASPAGKAGSKLASVNVTHLNPEFFNGLTPEQKLDALHNTLVMNGKKAISGTPNGFASENKNYFSSGRAAAEGLEFNPRDPKSLVPLSLNGKATDARVNSSAAPHFQAFLQDLEAAGYKVNSLGGYYFRNKRGGTSLSEHAYGNAIDINPGSNPFRSGQTDLPANIAQLAAKHGLIWGGNWHKGSDDPMHFEWAGPAASAALAEYSQTGVASAGAEGAPVLREPAKEPAKPEVKINKPGEFDTPLFPGQEAEFAAWKNKVAPNDSGEDYDWRGAFLGNVKPSENGHWPDTYKKPNHPTFSDQSQYAVGKYRKLAGHWEGDKFVPGAKE